MKEVLLTILRNKKTPISDFRRAADNLSAILANEVANFLPKEKIAIQTPIVKTSGYKFKNNIILAPILRAGIAMLPQFLKYFGNLNIAAKVAVIGSKRDEKTLKPNLYYQNIPKISKNDNILILDPMLATGGSACKAIEILMKSGVLEKNIIFVGIVASPEGIKKIKNSFPGVKMIIAGRDRGLTKNKYIIPGLGDFGDRYFGN
ncbi:uracil phosphoribosyltransferase [Candidatus Wolfebacteria bacterium]|nr:uracil phosphoribosyltransferase [Candidatus Wolfebacteria bacterium]